MKINELYKSMLSSVGVVVDSQGFASTVRPFSTESQPMMVGGKRLVLPYAEQLDQTDWSNRIGFHPLLQNFSAGESHVMEAVRNRANSYYDFMVGMMFLNLAALAADPEKHTSLTPEQSKYIHPFSSADAKFVKVLKNIVTAKAGIKKTFEFIRFTVVMGREWQGQKRNRVAVASFPLYDALPKEKKPCTIAGQKLTAEQTSMMREMYEFLFENIRDREYYTLGTDSKLGPSVESFFGLLGKIINIYNHHLQVLGDAMTGGDMMLIPNDWQEQLEKIVELTSEIRSIPALDGNAGRTRTGGQANAPMLINERTAPPVAASTEPITVVTPQGQPTASTAPIAQTAYVPATQHSYATSQAASQPIQQPGNNMFSVRIGEDISNSVPDQRTQLPDPGYQQQQEANPIQGILNLAGFHPSAPVAPLNYSQQPPQQVVQQAQVQQPAVTRPPEDAIFLNNQLYVPLVAQGTGAPPVGSIIHDGRVYIPFGATAPAATTAVAGTYTYGAQTQVTDPAQVPGLSAAEVAMYRSNPVLWQNYLATRQQGQTTAMAQQHNQRMNQVPSYLRNLAEAAQEQQNRSRYSYR